MLIGAEIMQAGARLIAQEQAVVQTAAAKANKAYQEVEPVKVVEEFLERIGIVLDDRHCSEAEAQKIAAAQIGKAYRCFMRKPQN